MSSMSFSDSIRPSPRTTYSMLLASTTFAPTLLLLRCTASNTVRNRNVECAQLRRVHVDLILANESADARNFRDSRNGVELVSNEPVLKRAQRARIVRAIDRVPEHLADARRVRVQALEQHPQEESSTRDSGAPGRASARSTRRRRLRK